MTQGSTDQGSSEAVNAVIVAVGTELLFGTTVNTNAAYISEKLHEIGIGVLAHHTTGDNPRRLLRTLEISFEEANIVIATGGLGPTQDDLTKEVIAEYLGVPLEYDAEAERRIVELFERIGHQHFTENNRKQAYLPAGATPFYNDRGTAPGFALEVDGRLIIALPGPPREMTRMMTESVLPYLAGRSDVTIYSETLNFVGVGESRLETALLPLIDGQTDPTIATYAKQGECNVRITSLRRDAAEAQAAVQAMAQRARELVEQYLREE
jgi:nicotinamide-nucleotide amidase